MKFTIVRFLKSIFIQLRLHILFSPFTGGLLNLAYMTKLSKWVSENKKIAYNDFYSKWDYDKRYKLYSYLLERENLRAPINYLEFGVATGVSFNWWMAENTHPDSAFYGFDTFTGLPEDFGPYKKGTFNTENNIPRIKDERGKFYQGLFQQTLPEFLKAFDNKNKTVLMLDADLYTATFYTLASIAPYLKKGDIIFFDEFVVPTHEFMAYQHFINAWYFNMEL
ncbi:MAG: class I SAM-dependent methyltransferase, partial [Ginsengibacter sp.]